MKKKNALIYGAVVLCFVAVFCVGVFFLMNTRETKLRRQGNQIVQRIEHFQEIYHRLPRSLEELGFKQNSNDNALFYAPNYHGGSNYMLWFGSASDDPVIYYSDHKQWERSWRSMK